MLRRWILVLVILAAAAPSRAAPLELTVAGSGGSLIDELGLVGPFPIPSSIRMVVDADGPPAYGDYDISLLEITLGATVLRFTEFGPDEPVGYLDLTDTAPSDPSPSDEIAFDDMYEVFGFNGVVAGPGAGLAAVPRFDDGRCCVVRLWDTTGTSLDDETLPVPAPTSFTESLVLFDFFLFTPGGGPSGQLQGGIILDETTLTIAHVPEPGPTALILSGLAALAARRLGAPGRD
jgi:hypothetical protein